MTKRGIGRKRLGAGFEKRTASILQLLSPSAQISHDVSIVGQLSRVERQFDVRAVDPVAYEYILFECKDRRRPLDVEVVDAFVGKLADIGGSPKAALVSNSRYTQAAMNMASAAGIDCLELVDTRDPKIKAQLRVTVLVRDAFVADLGLLKESVQRHDVPTRLPHLKLHDVDGRETNAADVMVDAWNSQLIPHHVGYHCFSFRALGYPQCATTYDKWISTEDIVVGVEVSERCWRGSLAILNTEGLYNTGDRTYATTSLTTEALDLEDLPRWQPVDPRVAGMLSVSLTQYVSTPLLVRVDQIPPMNPKPA